MKRIAVLSVQGAFIEHERIFQELGAQTLELRCAADLEKPFDALCLPGGESTTQGKLLRELGMMDDLHKRLDDGLPVFATCAGLILLARTLTTDATCHFRTLDVTVERNGYGRQLSSFQYTGDFGEIHDVPMSFIRAPRIVAANGDVEVMARCNGEITGVRQNNQLAMTFHPELSTDYRVHQYFLEQCL